jgi:hypothetical protein
MKSKHKIIGVLISLLVPIFVTYGLYPAQAAPLYSFTSHIFTNCTATGQYGPTLSNCTTAYSSSSWTSNTANYNVTSGIQYWTVPVSGDYIISAAGAKGGNGSTSIGGFGAVETGTFTLAQGSIIRILVGQIGGTGSAFYGSGGGGTFVVASPYNTNASILVIAGGGGGGYGSSTCATAAGGQIVNNPTGGTYTAASGGGGGGATNQFGGTGFNNGGGQSASTYAGGGAGFGGNGGRYNGTNTASGLAFINGGTGGDQVSGSPGGFGGGGGIGDRTGGGGGYSGGNSENAACGIGGGSYNSGSSQSAVAKANAGMGYVSITYIPPVIPILTLSASDVSTFRTGSNITVNSNVAGKVTLLANGKRIPNCINLTLTGSGSAYSVTCSWKASLHGSVNVSASYFPTGSNVSTASSASITISAARRNNSR